MASTESALAPVASITRRDAVLHELRRAILAGDLQPGERLREVPLAQRLGVSRPTLREALYQLIHEGLLVQETYKGIAVARIDTSTIADVAAVRVALETVGARAIAADRSGPSRARLEQAWDAYLRASGSADPSAEHEAHLELHRTIWVASDNSMLERIWPIVAATINLAMSTDQTTRADPERAHHVHGSLVAAILENRARDIDRELRAHIRTSADELVQLLERATP